MFRFPDKPTPSRPAVLAALRDGEWLCQFKWDGWRTVVTLDDGGRLSFTSRDNKPIPISSSLSQRVAESFLRSNVPQGTTLDAEWTGRRAGLGEGLVFFDAIRLGGLDLYQWSAEHRFQALSELGLNTVDGVSTVETTTSGYAEMFERSKSLPHTEGVVLKRLASRLVWSIRSCQDHPEWLKVKWRDGEDGQLRVA